MVSPVLSNLICGMLQINSMLGKVKIHLSLCIPCRHKGSGSKPPLMLNLGTKLCDLSASNPSWLGEGISVLTEWAPLLVQMFGKELECLTASEKRVTILQTSIPYPSLLYKLFRLPVYWTNTRVWHFSRHKTPTFCVLESLAAAQPLSIASHTVAPVMQDRSLWCPHSQNWNPNLHTQAFCDSNASSLSPAAHVREWYGTCRRHLV